MLIAFSSTILRCFLNMSMNLRVHYYNFSSNPTLLFIRPFLHLLTLLDPKSGTFRYTYVSSVLQAKQFRFNWSITGSTSNFPLLHPVSSLHTPVITFSSPLLHGPVQHPVDKYACKNFSLHRPNYLHYYKLKVGLFKLIISRLNNVHNPLEISVSNSGKPLCIIA